jgi:hypothetical protein
MKRLFRYLLRKSKLFVLNISKVIFIKLDKGYQDNHKEKTNDQFNLIHAFIQQSSFPKNILEIGTNKCNLLKKFNEIGFVCFGVDKVEHHRSDYFHLNRDVTTINFQDLPKFSYTFILSVHHQFVSAYGHDWTKDLLSKLISKTKGVIFIEFAAINKKFGAHQDELFKDNDDESIIEYAFSFLSDLNKKVTYLGKTLENNTDEKYRFLFAVQIDNV